MNILVTGSNGQLGSEIKELSNNYSYNFFFTDVNDLDISKEENIKRYVNDKNIDLIINCAAYTAVDKAEKEKDFANLVNHKAVGYLADLSKEKNIILIHISTDYVFSGESYKPYKEVDPVKPKNVYGLSKLKGEEYFKNSGAKGIIIRTSWLYSYYGHNFVKTMLKFKDKKKLGVVFDQVGTPTYARDLAYTILEIIDKHIDKLKSYNAEIFHFSNEGVISWYDFAKAIFDILNINIEIYPIFSIEYQMLAERPYYSVLDKTKIKKEFNIKISYWKESLVECLKKFNYRDSYYNYWWNRIYLKQFYYRLFKDFKEISKV